MTHNQASCAIDDRVRVGESVKNVLQNRVRLRQEILSEFLRLTNSLKNNSLNGNFRQDRGFVIELKNLLEGGHPVNFHQTIYDRLPHTFQHRRALLVLDDPIGILLLPREALDVAEDGMHEGA